MQYDETGRPLVDDTGRPLDWDVYAPPPPVTQITNPILDLASKSGLKVGDPGTWTLYATPTVGANYDPAVFNSWSQNNWEGAVPFAIYDPTLLGFNQPEEGWDRFFNQIFSRGKVQEEYLPLAELGRRGIDTTNFDYTTGLNPFASDYGLPKASFVQKPTTPWYKDVDIVLPLALAGGLIGAAAFAPTSGALGGGAATGAEGAAAATAAGAGAVDDALGAFLIEAGELPAASAYGQAVAAGTPNWAIPGVSGAGGELGYSGAVGGAVNDPLGAWLIEQGYPMDPQYAAQVTAGTQNWAAQPSIWDKAKDLLEKKPSLPPGTGSGQATGAGDGEGEQMNIWSDTATPKAFGAVQPYQPTYLNLQQAAFPFEAELQRRLALIRGAQ